MGAVPDVPGAAFNAALGAASDDSLSVAPDVLGVAPDAATVAEETLDDEGWEALPVGCTLVKGGKDKGKGKRLRLYTGAGRISCWGTPSSDEESDTLILSSWP